MSKSVEEMLGKAKLGTDDVVERAMVLVRGMSKEEFNRFIQALFGLDGGPAAMALTVAEIQKKAIMDYLAKNPVPEAVEVEATGAWHGKSKGRVPYWCKTFGGWDESKKKGFRLEGEFVRRRAFEDHEGVDLAVGLSTVGGKHYAICRVDALNTIEFEREGDGKAVEIEGLKVVEGPFNNWDEFERVAKERGL